MPTPGTYEALGILVLGPLAVTLLLFEIHRTFGTSYVFRWTLSFACLAVFHAATTFIVLQPGAPMALHFLASIAGGAAAYLQIAFMLWGTFELARRKQLKIGDSHRGVMIVAALGALFG